MRVFEEAHPKLNSTACSRLRRSYCRMLFRRTLKHYHAIAQQQANPIASTKLA
jgi:hypothetical protein